MKNYYGFIDEMKAINILESHKGKLIVTIVNLENGTSERNLILKEEGMEVIRKAQAIGFDDDEYIPHIMCYTSAQNDIEHITRKGKVYDILL